MCRAEELQVGLSRSAVGFGRCDFADAQAEFLLVGIG
jgi:hypothetical protein